MSKLAEEFDPFNKRIESLYFPSMDPFNSKEEEEKDKK